MNIKEEVIDMKNELEQVKSESFALELLKDQRKQNKRLFIMWLITFVMFLALLGYTIFLLNDIGVIEDSSSIDIQGVENIDSSHIKIGDDVWEKSK